MDNKEKIVEILTELASLACNNTLLYHIGGRGAVESTKTIDDFVDQIDKAYQEYYLSSGKPPELSDEQIRLSAYGGTYKGANMGRDKFRKVARAAEANLMVWHNADKAQAIQQARQEAILETSILCAEKVKQARAEVAKEIFGTVDGMLDSQGLGEDNFKASWWQSYQQLKAHYKEG